MKLRAWIMFLTILVVYAMAQLAFNSVNQANSTGNGPVATLFPLSATDPSIARISTWSIPLTRGITSVLLGLLLHKIGHKNGIIFAFSLMIISLPFVFTPEIKQSLLSQGISEDIASRASYGLFLVFRIFLAVGGPASLIYTAPLIVKFFVEPKQRYAASKITNAPAEIAGIVASLLFINAMTRDGIAGQWTLIGGVIIGVIILGMIVYLIFGMQFNIKTPNHNSIFIEDKAPESKNQFSFILKQRRVWVLCLATAFSLYVIVEPASGVLSNFWNRTDANVAGVWNLNTGQILQENSIATYQFAWQILFSLGLYTGLWTIAKWSSTKYQIAPYAGVMIILGTAFLGISYGIGVIGLSLPVVAAFTLIFGLLGATFVFGTEIISGVIVYKWGFNPSQVTYFTSFNWTFIYISFSALDIITAFIGTAGVSAHRATYADLIVNDPSLFNTTLNGDLTTFLKIRNNLIGWVDPNNPDLFTAQKWNVSQDFFNSFAPAINNLHQQYLPQLSIIAVLPVLSGVFFLLIRSKLKTEVAFSLMHFKANYLQFIKLKRVWNHCFKRQKSN
ncbi:hypothetical protein [[Mycoplasma] testudinis]|uniref:hypothetical protein n=1 Tax=[Mycoplasma] testudinis TaxID=33924 RepID=UPI000AE52F1A|nr:hypothetical protein [[Mycoplasma] testudinis]